MIDVLYLLAPYSKGSKRWLILNLITAIIGNAMIMINPLLIGRLINELKPNDIDFNLVITYLIIIASLYLLGSVILWFSQAFSHNFATRDRKSTRLNSSHVRISYAVFC